MQPLDETDISFFPCPCNYQAFPVAASLEMNLGLPLLRPLHRGADERQVPGLQTGLWHVRVIALGLEDYVESQFRYDASLGLGVSEKR